MTQTMRERLASIAEREANVVEHDGAHVDNWPVVLDAILAELREPDDGMTIAIGQLGMDLGRQPTIAEAYPAMIDAVREEK